MLKLISHFASAITCNYNINSKKWDRLTKERKCYRFPYNRFCALAGDRKSTDTFWCMKFEQEGIGWATDDYGFFIPEGCNYLQVIFLE